MRDQSRNFNGFSSKALKSGIWYTASNFLIKSIGFITTPIFTRLLSKSEFGLYNNYTSWLSIITIIATLNLDATLISARYDYEDSFDEYILSVLTLSTISTSVWIVVANLFIDSLQTLLGIDQIYINVMLIYLLFMPAINLYQARERYYFEYKKTVASSLFIVAGTALLSVILVMNLSDRLFGRIIGAAVPTVLIGSIFYCYFIKKGKKINANNWKYALPICMPYIPHLLSLTILNSVDRTMITKFCGPEDTAMYSVAYTCGSMVTLLITSMNSAYAPWLGEELALGNTQKIKKISRIYILSFSILVVGIMAVAPEALLVMGGKAYLEAKYVLAPIAMGCVCQFLYTMFVNIEQFKKKTIGMAIASVTAALVNWILNYIFIPKVGYLAAAYTTLVGYLCLLIIHMILVHRLGLSSIYDYRMIMETVFVMICVTILMSVLYSNNLLRYSCLTLYIIVLLVITYKNKNNLVRYPKRRI